MHWTHDCSSYILCLARQRLRELEAQRYQVMLADYKTVYRSFEHRQLVESNYRDHQQLRRLELHDAWRRDRAQARQRLAVTALAEERTWREALETRRKQHLADLNAFESELEHARQAKKVQRMAVQAERQQRETERRDRLLADRQRLLLAEQRKRDADTDLRMRRAMQWVGHMDKVQGDTARVVEERKLEFQRCKEEVKQRDRERRHRDRLGHEKEQARWCERVRADTQRRAFEVAREEREAEERADALRRQHERDLQRYEEGGGETYCGISCSLISHSCLLHL